MGGQPSLDLTIADQELDAAEDAVLATAPTSLTGILALIDYGRREHFLDDPSAEAVIALIERAVTGMADRR